MNGYPYDDGKVNAAWEAVVEVWMIMFDCRSDTDMPLCAEQHWRSAHQSV
jgi:hypothetical protein